MRLSSTGKRGWRDEDVMEREEKSGWMEQSLDMEFGVTIQVQVM